MEGFEIRTSKWNPQNIRTINTEDGNEMGCCYGTSMRTWLTLLKHTTEADFIDTSIEESIHQAIRDDITGAPDESLYFDVEQEEWAIERIKWALADWILID